MLERSGARLGRADTTPPAEVTFDDYVNALARAVQHGPFKPIIAGHSMAGLIVTHLAEWMPDRIGGLACVAAGPGWRCRSGLD